MSDRITRAMEETMARYDVPGLVIAVARAQEPVAHLVMGHDDAGESLTTKSLFPVASITKLATALAILRLVDTGTLALDESLARYLPDAAAAREGVTIRRLLSHTSGLPVDLANEDELYTHTLSWQLLARECLTTPLQSAPFTRVIYSNVGYGLLAIIVERQTNLDFSAALRSLVIEPLGIEAYIGTEPPRPTARLRDVRSAHVGTELEPYHSSFWRALAIPWGGLVTTVGGALALVRAFHGSPASFLRDETRAEAIRNQAADLSGGYGAPFNWQHAWWGLGPDLRDNKRPHWAPVEASQNCFGHAGASGCVAWLDPDANVAWAICGARTADNGWLLRATPPIGAAILAE